MYTYSAPHCITIGMVITQGRWSTLPAISGSSPDLYRRFRFESWTGYMDRFVGWK